VTQGAARDAYGVVVHAVPGCPGQYRLDEAATQALRADVAA
jgi:hypothetical protein